MSRGKSRRADSPAPEAAQTTGFDWPHLDLLVLVIVTVLAMAVSLGLPEASPVRVPFGVLLSLVLPGYGIALAAFPGRSFSRGERVLFTLGLSLAVAVLSGIALNWSPWQLSTEAFTVFLGGVILLSCAIALVRRVRMAPWEQVADMAASEENFSQPLRFSLLQWLTFGLAAIIAVVAVASAAVEAKRNPTSDVLQLWMVPVQAEGEPKNTVRIGVRNFEYANTDYRLQLMRGGYVVQEWPQLKVDQGNTWEITMTLKTDWPGVGPVEAVLYQPEKPSEPFRKTSYWLSANE